MDPCNYEATASVVQQGPLITVTMLQLFRGPPPGIECSFSPPPDGTIGVRIGALPAGTYTVRIDNNFNAYDYTFQFTVEPLPAAVPATNLSALLLIAAAMIGAAMRVGARMEH